MSIKHLRAGITLSKSIVVGFALGCLVPSSIEANPRWVEDAIIAAEDIQTHKDAVALILCNHAEIKIKKDGSTKRRVRKAIEVLKRGGVDEATIREWVSSNREVKNLKAWRVSHGGSWESLNKDRLKYYSQYQITGYYDDNLRMEASFPTVHTGDVVAWEYNIEEKKGWGGYFQSFIFQLHLPVVSSRLIVRIPEGWVINISSRNLEPVVHTVEEDKYIWEAHYLPFRPEEPYSPGIDFLARVVKTSCHDPLSKQGPHFGNWRDASLWIFDLFEKAAQPNDTIRAFTNDLLIDTDSAWQKLVKIAEFVRDEIRYVAVEIDEGRFRPRPALTTYRNRFGDCKDKVTLLRSMLTAVDIPSDPALAKINGLVDNDFPSPFQFDHVIIAVPVEELELTLNSNHAVHNGWLYFDPTDPSTRVGLLPTPIVGTPVLKVSPSDSMLIDLPILSPSDRKRVYLIDATVAPDFSVTAEVRISDYGNLGSVSSYQHKVIPLEDQIEELQKHFTESMKAPKLSNYQTFSDADSAWVTFILEGASYIDAAGDLMTLKPDFCIPKDIEELKCEDRVNPVSFGAPASYETDITWHLPEGWRVIELPDPFEAACDIASVKGQMDTTNNTIQIRSLREYKGSTIPGEDCQEVAVVVKSLQDYASMRLLIAR